MYQNIQRLLYSLAGFAMIAAAGVSTSARADDPYDTDYGTESRAYDCLGNICVGTQVRVIGGEWVGHAGSVVGVDPYNDTVTVINSSGYYLYPYVTDVRSIYGDSQGSNCTRNVCLGDQVRVLYGEYAGYTGQIVGTNEYTLQATILISGQYIIVNIRDLTVLSNQPQPMPRPVPRVCPIGYVWDYYRGCVRVTGSYPVPPRRPYPTPYPRPGNYPRPMPYPRPVPHPQPMPYPRPGNYPRPGSYPTPGGYPTPGNYPRPGRVESPRYPTPGGSPRGGVGREGGHRR